MEELIGVGVCFFLILAGIALIIWASSKQTDNTFRRPSNPIPHWTGARYVYKFSVSKPKQGKKSADEITKEMEDAAKETEDDLG